MCSVVGCIWKKHAKDVVLGGLTKTQYRGYDSAGFIAFDAEKKDLIVIKTVGTVEALKERLDHLNVDTTIALGHTRWATHGLSNELNAHPQVDCFGQVGVVHNGIIENYKILKDELVAKGHQFLSQTDTEVVAHIWEECEQQLGGCIDPSVIVALVVKKIIGAYALIFLAQHYTDCLFFARSKSPLCVGFIDEEPVLLASDTLAFDSSINRVFYVPDNTYGYIKANELFLYNFLGSRLDVSCEPFVHTSSNYELGGYSHYMVKEVYEQKDAVDRTVSYFNDNRDTILDLLALTKHEICNLISMRLIGCGASWHAGRIGQFFFEEIANLPTAVHLASEFRCMKLFSRPDQLSIAISQSGETADTLEAMRLLKYHGMHTVSLVNVATSSMVRESSGSFLMQAGPEVAVASTKAFAAMLGSLYWLAHYIGNVRGAISNERLDRVVHDIGEATTALHESMNRYAQLIKHELAPYYGQFDRAICLGRHISYPFALEAALKFKEINYTFAQCYPAGELKHGPLALIDQRTPVFVFSVLDEIPYRKLLNNVQEAKARGAHIVAFLFVGQYELAALADAIFEIPIVTPLLAPLAMNGVMLLLVCHIGIHLGLSIDKPRNLAKSVTVE